MSFLGRQLDYKGPWPKHSTTPLVFYRFLHQRIGFKFTEALCHDKADQVAHRIPFLLVNSDEVLASVRK